MARRLSLNIAAFGDAITSRRTSSLMAPPTNVDYLKLMRQTLPFLWPEDLNLCTRMCLCATMLVLARVANVMGPQYFKCAVDQLADRRFPVDCVVAFAALRFLQATNRELRQFFWLEVEQHISKRLTLRVFAHLHSMSLRYHVERKTGEVLKVMERGAAGLHSIISMALFTAVPAVIDLILACAVLLAASEILLAAIIFGSMALYILVTIYMTEWRKDFRRQAIEAENAINDRAINSLLNFETVKYFGAESREEAALCDRIQLANSAHWKSEISLYALAIAQHLIFAAAGFACLYICAARVVEGTLTVGDFVMIQTYVSQLGMPLAWLSTAWRIIQQGFIDMEKTLQLLMHPQEILDIPGAPELQVTAGRIHFDSVYFGYKANSALVLRGFTLDVLPHQTVAIVGATGAGKSTIGRLLFRLYDLDRLTGGAIRIDGTDVRDVQQVSLRRAIGVVPQDTVLFNETVLYNIRYGRPEATDDEIESAARVAAIHDTIMMRFPEKYNTKIGERGLRLSGGEKQRIAIARTVLKNPKIILLDEATSALDTHTEHSIQTSLDTLCKGKTTIIVAHRLTTVVHADCIVVLADGRIAEQGAHADLVGKENGLYAAMWKNNSAVQQLCY